MRASAPALLLALLAAGVSAASRAQPSPSQADPGAAQAERTAAAAPNTAAPRAAVPGIVATSAVVRRRLPNTVADATLAIEVRGRDLPGVQRQLAERSQALVGALRAQGVDRLRTEMVGLEPELRESRNGPDRLVGYSATMEVSFRAAQDRLGDALDAALRNGASAVRSAAFLPREEDADRARQELAAEATRTAIAQARAVAEAAGLHIASVRAIEVGRDASRPPFLEAERPAPLARVQQAPRLATEGGSSEVAVVVTVRAALAQ